MTLGRIVPLAVFFLIVSQWRPFEYWKIGLIATVICVLAFFRWLSRPLNRIRGPPACDNEWRKFVSNLKRQLGPSKDNYPPVFPNGWFCIVESRFLRHGQVMGVTAFGQRLVIFRSQLPNNDVHVLIAYCPHMGADMSVGGRVARGDCLQCPFHGWTFSGHDGKCVAIPYASEIPNFANVKRWTSVERNGHIYVWYHCDDSEPSWEIPDIERIKDGTWTYRGRTEHYVESHIQDIPENGADIAHLNYLHRALIFHGGDINRIDLSQPPVFFGEHKWTAEWQQQPAPNGHIGVMRLWHHIELFGYHIPFSDFKVEGRQIGPGIVYLYYDAGFLGKGIYVHHVTPMEPLLQKVIHHVYAEEKTPNLVAKFFMWAEAQQLERDIMIWNKKRYLSKPLLVKEDATIQRHRRWYNQFYTENSPRISDQLPSAQLDF